MRFCMFHVSDALTTLKKGVMFVSEDRRGVGLLLDQSIETNITVAAMAGFLAACLMAIVMALAAGYGYGLLLNRMRVLR